MELARHLGPGTARRQLLLSKFPCDCVYYNVCMAHRTHQHIHTVMRAHTQVQRRQTLLITVKSYPIGPKFFITPSDNT